MVNSLPKQIKNQEKLTEWISKVIITTTTTTTIIIIIIIIIIVMIKSSLSL